jgi:hypothetical protein
MEKIEYEGTIGGHSFLMKEKTVIEVWDNLDDEHPKTFIYLRDGDVKDKKSFDVEISHWAMLNGIV